MNENNITHIRNFYKIFLLLSSDYFQVELFESKVSFWGDNYANFLINFKINI